MSYPFAYFLGLLGQRFGIGDVLIGDGGKELLFVLAVERRLTDEHLVEQNAVRPPVDAPSVRLVQNDLHTEKEKQHVQFVEAKRYGETEINQGLSLCADTLALATTTTVSTKQWARGIFLEWWLGWCDVM